ncbi:MAG TPA: cell division protein FtsA, partial [Bacteroidetes bacterium]|nr:cell division protein FtsA [Bacteroidota bacterium]
NELSENEIVSIPGIRGREAREISIKNLSMIIQARVEEILELVYYEIKASNVKNLAGGIVLTGGGSQLKHISQLAEFITGLDARIGYPNEHLAKGMVDEVKSPIYATSVGLVLRGLAEERSQINYVAGSAEDMVTPRKSPLFERIKDWLKDEADVPDYK